MTEYDANVIERIVVARKAYACDVYPSRNEEIKPGDKYLLITEYPGGESGFADAAGHPVRMRVCRECSKPRVVF